MTSRARRTAAAACVSVALLAACGAPDTPAAGAADAAEATATGAAASASSAGPGNAAPSPAAESTLPPGVTERPVWLGTRPLADSPDALVPPQTTPPELVDRRFATVDVLPPPPDDAFVASVVPVPPDVAVRSTWTPACPVALTDLRYVTVAFWGFDGRPHTGELLVHADVAEDVVDVFARLHATRFPIEQMTVASPEDLVALPTGDGNVTGSFVCRPTRGSTRWSEHAYGLAVDVNPFHNPYERRGRVLPELATAYLDRDHVRPGMVLRGDVVTSAFADIGWTWGGDFRSLTDTMHFSRDGR